MPSLGRVPRDRTLGWLAVGLGLGFAVAVQAIAPVGVPLYDGVSVIEPYRFLHPAGDQVGNPTSFEATKDVSGGQSPALIAATTESPPQAQLVAMEGAFDLAGASALKVSITPVETSVQPAGGQLASNVYRFSVTGPAGAPLTPKPCDTCRTLVLRVSDEALEASIAHLVDGAWVPLQTLHAGLSSMLQVNAPAMGDYAVIAAAPVGGDSGGVDALIFGAIALALFFAAVAGLFWYRRRPPPVPVAQLGPGRGRIPSKRKGPRRPPSGRSGE